MKRALLLVVLLGALPLLFGCGALDSFFMPGPPAQPGGPPTPSTADTVANTLATTPAIPYASLAGGALGLLAGIYQTLRKRQVESEHIALKDGVEAVKVNWDKIETLADLARHLPKT
jgi:hypothetical protein